MNQEYAEQVEHKPFHLYYEEMPNLDDYGQRLTFILDQKNIGTKELRMALASRGLDFSNSAIYKIKNSDQNDLMSRRNYAIADFLEINPRWLSTGEGSPNDTLESSIQEDGLYEVKLTDDEMSHLTSYRSMTEGQKRQLRQIAFIISSSPQPN